MSTEKTNYDAPEGGARIEDLPLSDSQLASEERDKRAPMRSPPGEFDDADDARRSPPPEEPDEPEVARRAPPPSDPEPEE